MCNNKDKPYIVYSFLILFGVAILLLSGVLGEARDDLQNRYAEQSADDASHSQLTEIISDTAE